MHHTRPRLAGALLFVVFLLSPDTGRTQDKKSDPRKEFEAGLAGRPAQELSAFVDQLAKEWSAHKGAVEVAAAGFTAQAGETGKARQRVEELKPPADPPLGGGAADAAVKDAQARADYAATRLKHLDGLKAALAALTAAGADFDRAATAADLHLFKMRTAAASATKAGAVALPEAVGATALDDAAARVRTLTAEVRPATEKAKGEATALDKELPQAQKAAEAASAKLAALKGAQSDAAAVAKFAEQARTMTPAELADKSAQLRKLLAEKLSAIDGDASDYKKATATAAEVRAAFDAAKDPFAAKDRAEADTPGAAPLDEQARKLVVVRQHLSARVRLMAERDEKAQALVAALDEAERKGVAYATTLDDARRLAGQSAALAAEIAARVGRGDLEAAKAPGGTPPTRPGLDADAAAVAGALGQLRTERDALRQPDADRDNLLALTRELLARVSARAELLADLKRLAGEYATARKDRPEAEQKQLDQRAAARMSRDAGPLDWALARDRSQGSADAAALLAAYYRELIEYDDRADNLKKQNETLAALVDSARHEAADIAKLRALLEKRVASSAGAKAWDGWLAARAATALRSEEAVYRDEEARLAAVAGADGRRVRFLVGTASSTNASEATELMSGTTGEIIRARGELRRAQLRGLRNTAIKLGLILLAALVVPWLLVRVLRRSIRGGTDETGNPSPVLSALRGVLKVGVWIAAVALALSVLGYDVTALVVALAIGILAIALAARPMIADVLGAVVIFAERRFKVGDVVRLGTDEPARVVGLTWRSTALKNASGLVVSVPNRTVTETAVENLSRGGETYDALAVTVSTDKDAGKVITVIRAAVAQCKNVSADNGVTVLRYTQKGALKVVDYRFWWFLKDYEARNKTRDEVFARIALGLANEDMTGIEVSLG